MTRKYGSGKEAAYRVGIVADLDRAPAQDGALVQLRLDDELGLGNLLDKGTGGPSAQECTGQGSFCAEGRTMKEWVLRAPGLVHSRRRTEAFRKGKTNEETGWVRQGWFISTKRGTDVFARSTTRSVALKRAHFAEKKAAKPQQDTHTWCFLQ